MMFIFYFLTGNFKGRWWEESWNRQYGNDLLCWFIIYRCWKRECWVYCLLFEFLLACDLNKFWVILWSQKLFKSQFFLTKKKTTSRIFHMKSPTALFVVESSKYLNQLLQCNHHKMQTMIHRKFWAFMLHNQLTFTKLNINIYLNSKYLWKMYVSGSDWLFRKFVMWFVYGGLWNVNLRLNFMVIFITWLLRDYCLVDWSRNFFKLTNILRIV